MKILKSFGYAFSGIKICFVTQTNFKIHLILLTAAIIMGVFFNITTTNWLLIMICTALVLCAEIINTAVEKLCDVVDPKFNIKIKVVKDIAAAAVFINALISITAGLFIFLPKIIFYIKNFYK